MGIRIKAFFQIRLFELGVKRTSFVFRTWFRYQTADCFAPSRLDRGKIEHGPI